jgi:membrane peptidoglycan carboxypeptidase
MQTQYNKHAVSKNVFLTEKTVSRKLEEILLVYILENNRIVSKERMLEVYFNIIEWGPNVYGIGEASRFTSRKVHQLTLNECLYLMNYSQSRENSCINLMTKENLGILPQHRKVSS